jgi:ABC-2 type transport system ATP-binding protein
MLHMIAGFLAPSAGTVTLDGRRTHGDPEVYRGIGLVPEREAVYAFLTARQFVAANARLQGVADVDAATARAIAAVELEDAQDRVIGTYSKGMRQRAKVAASLVHDPQVLLLDEPFNGMDPRQRLHMMGLLRRMAADGRTILFSSHILEEVERLAERVLVIVAGRLAASGNFREIRRLMTDRPHTFTVRSSDDRRLAAVLVAEPAVSGVALDDGLLTVRAADFGGFARIVPGVARSAAITLYELLPTDESLESVFSYLVAGGSRR